MLDTMSFYSEVIGFWSRFSDKFPIFTFTLYQAKSKKYNLSLLMTMFIPGILMVILLNFSSNDYSSGGYWLWYYRIYFRLGLFFLTSLVSLIIATGIYRDEISDETIVYIMTKAINRQRIFIERILAYYIIAMMVVTPGIITGHIIGDLSTRLYDNKFSLSLINSLINLSLELLGAYVLIIGLGSVFVTTGFWLRRPMLINLVLAFGIILEQFLLDLISNKFEPVYIAQNMVAREVRGFENITATSFDRNLNANLQTFWLPYGTTAWEGLINFIIILTITLLSGLFLAKRKQFN